MYETFEKKTPLPTLVTTATTNELLLRYKQVLQLGYLFTAHWLHMNETQKKYIVNCKQFSFHVEADVSNQFKVSLLSTFKFFRLALRKSRNLHVICYPDKIFC